MEHLATSLKLYELDPSTSSISVVVIHEMGIFINSNRSVGSGGLFMHVSLTLVAVIIFTEHVLKIVYLYSLMNDDCIYQDCIQHTPCHQMVIDRLQWMSSCLSWGKIWTICSISVLRNYRKWNYIFFRFLKETQRGDIFNVLRTHHFSLITPALNGIQTTLNSNMSVL